MNRLTAQAPVCTAQICKGRTITTGRLLNIEALLVQMVGTAYTIDPYTYCTSGSSVFAECITVNGLFGRLCTNCYYSSEGARCSFCKFYIL